MKLFVTGVCGRLGRAVAAEAAAQSIGVVGIDLQPWPNGEPKPANLTLHQGRSEDTALLDRVLPGCDAVVHTAGLHGGDAASADLAGFLNSNVVSVARLLEQAVRHGVRSVALSSTMEVVVGAQWSNSGIAMLSEESPPRPDTPYSLSKLLMEELGRAFSQQSGLSVASLRYMAFGYKDDREAGPRLLARVVPMRDAARAALLAASRDDLRGEVFHIGPATPLTNTDLVTAMSDPESVVERHFLGASAILKARGTPVTSAHFWPVTSTRRAAVILGWKPRYFFEHWLLENGWSPLPAT